jgi:hypothetical protein
VGLLLRGIKRDDVVRGQVPDQAPPHAFLPSKTAPARSVCPPLHILPFCTAPALSVPSACRKYCAVPPFHPPGMPGICDLFLSV